MTKLAQPLERFVKVLLRTIVNELEICYTGY